jgi:NAD(P)-dependent dehydrogenase (short-subunit alcohol dehydrogenase family)
MKDLEGRVAFVTGGGSGIGAGMARRLAAAGVKVAVADIRTEPAAAVAAEIVRANGAAVPVQVDVSDRASVEQAADAVMAAFGRVDIVCNNAGVAMHGVPVAAVPLADWDWVIGVNVIGVINGIQAFLPHIRAHGQGGHIVNTASIGGLQVNPSFLTGPYSMTKYAVVALSEALANELADTPIGVSVLCPAAVATGIHLSGRARPDRLGGAVERPENHFMGDMIKDGMAPDAVGTEVVRAIRDRRFWIFPHPETRAWIEARHARIMAGFDAMGAG